jgi:UDP-N-acetyl-D-glucosamine dehydrogenase
LTFLQEFEQKIENQSFVVGVFGLGYVGIPLSISMANAGFKVLGFDIVSDRVNELNSGQSPIHHIPDTDIATMKTLGFEATQDFRRATDCDALIICVPTPLNKSREPELGYVTSTLDSISPHLRAGQLLSLESTTWPGTTEQIIRPYVDNSGLKVGDDFFLVYSPEREDPANATYNTRSIPKIVGGITESCLRAGTLLYEKVIDVLVPVSSTTAAEMVKLLENIHRSINIGLANEMKVVADAMDLDIFEIIDAAKTKPFGFIAYYPGPGIGGHCIPVDPFYLTWKAREYGLHTRFIELSGEINAAMPQYVVDKTIKSMNQFGKSLKASKILVLGIAYKRDVDDVRESPSVVVMEILRQWGAEVSYSDPFLPVFPEMRDHDFDLHSIQLTPESIAEFDAVILLTDHSCFDYELILENAKILVDTRGRYRKSDSVVRA